MKKLLLIAAILGVYSFTSAQSFTFSFDNNNLNAGDTIQYPYTSNDLQIDFQFTNTSSEAITLQVTVNTIDAQGFDVYGVCAGDCAPGNVSPNFEIAAGATYTGCDARISVDNRAEDGLFTVTAANVNDPNDQITVYLHLYRPLAINQAENNTLSTYPNPATNNLNVNYTLPENNGQLILTNTLGAVVKTINLTSNQGTATINVANIPAGIYNLTTIAGNQKMSTAKVVIK